MADVAHAAPSIEDALAELFTAGVPAKKLYFAADIGNANPDEIEWFFGPEKTRRGRNGITKLPRAAVRFDREPGVNFWLVEIAEPIAQQFGIAHLACTDEDAERHRHRLEESLSKTLAGERL